MLLSVLHLYELREAILFAYILLAISLGAGLISLEIHDKDFLGRKKMWTPNKVFIDIAVIVHVNAN